MERQHSAAVSMTKESLQSAICKVPLIEGAKVGQKKAIFFLSFKVVSKEEPVIMF